MLLLLDIAVRWPNERRKKGKFDSQAEAFDSEKNMYDKKRAAILSGKDLKNSIVDRGI